MTTPAHTPAPWNWHDSSGRKNGKGEPIGIGRGITGDEPPLGSLSRFSFAVSDSAGFCVAHCTNALVTMSTATSEANARLIAAAPDLLDALNRLQASPNDPRAHRQALDAITKATA
jgi:hypothetical protein